MENPVFISVFLVMLIMPARSCRMFSSWGGANGAVSSKSLAAFTILTMISR